MEIISFRFQDFLSAFIILFAVIDITGLTPIIIDMKQKGQNIIAWKAAVYSLVTFLAFLFMGNMILNLFQVDISSFAIAGMSIVTRICMFINSFVIGFGQGFQPVCGFNYGAGLNRRVRQGFWYCVKVGVIFLAICSLIGYIYAPEVVSWFRKEDPQVIAVGAEALRWQLITLPLGAWVILCNMLLQTIRQPRRAVILSSSRQGLFFIPLILILPYFLQLQGVEMCQAAADLCSFLLALPLTIPVLKSLRIDRTPMKEENA